jgi:hypothetical protein
MLFNWYFISKIDEVQKGCVLYGYNNFNHLPRGIRELLYDTKKFKTVTKNFLLKESFYSINEYLEWSTKINHGSL